VAESVTRLATVLTQAGRRANVFRGTVPQVGPDQALTALTPGTGRHDWQIAARPPDSHRPYLPPVASADPGPGPAAWVSKL
jgi:hypothetical protein